MRYVNATVLWTAAFSCLVACGCGQSEDPAPKTAATESNPADAAAAHASTGTSKAGSAVPAMTVSRSESADASVTMDLTPDFREGSPEWTLREISKLRSQTIPTDPLEVARVRRERNRKIIDLATRVIAETHHDEAQLEFFNSAVHELLEARLEMALRGHPDDIDALYDDVRHLNDRDRESAAAEEAAFTLARYAHTNARRFAAQQPRWLEEFARQARVYADAYPRRSDRAAPLLFAAARSCELQSARAKTDAGATALLNEAKLCFTLLRDQFPEMPQGQQAVGILRRLSLEGQQLQEFSGPTLDGQQARIEALKGRPTVIAFWSSENAEFLAEVETLRATLEKHRADRVFLLGVNLDREEAAARKFLADNPLPGAHIFFSEDDQQRWDSPIVKYWGILDIPTFWILDQQGIVVRTGVSATELQPLLAQLCKQK